MNEEESEITSEEVEELKKIADLVTSGKDLHNILAQIDQT